MEQQPNHALTQYDDFAVKHLAAYNAFATIFEAQNPRPVLATISRDIVSMIVVFALTLVMIAAVIVSGSRTIDEFTVDNPLIGVVAFVMVEGGIMAYAFFRARRSASKERLQRTVHWATAGLIFTVIVGLGANVDSTLRAHSVILPDGVKTFLNLLVAISAPALGFISSDVLAIELMATDLKRRDAQRDFDAALLIWQDRLNNSWRSKQRDWGVRVEMPAQPQLPMSSVSSDVNLRKFTSIDRPSPKLKLALEWLREHPEHIETESRKLGELIGVSHATANKAQHIFRLENNV